MAVDGTKADLGSLESSLLQIVQDHQQRSLRIRERTGENPERTIMKTSGVGIPQSWFIIIMNHGLSGRTNPERRFYRATFVANVLHRLKATFLEDDKAKKDALRTAVRVSELLVDSVNGGVEEAFINEKRIEFEIRALISTIVRHKKQMNQWLAASNAMNSVLKEIGDFENWMKTMDFDCKSINTAICNIHQL